MAYRASVHASIALSPLGNGYMADVTLESGRKQHHIVQCGPLDSIGRALKSYGITHSDVYSDGLPEEARRLKDTVLGSSAPNVRAPPAPAAKKAAEPRGAEGIGPYWDSLQRLRQRLHGGVW